MHRKSFISGIGISIIATPALIKNTLTEPEPQLDKAIVQEFVRAAHSDKDIVVDLLEEYPTLINAAHDWGRGDFETALGAASHVGFLELAKYLIEKGAQTNIFTACLFGKLDILQLMLNAFPETLHAKGPHGFTLLHHAIRGGEPALPLKEYLESLGAKELRIPLY